MSLHHFDAQLALLNDVANAVADAVRGITDLGPSGQRDGQYALDLVADEAALAVLRSAGVNILSEESGTEHAGSDFTVIVDPIDGSTNFSRGIPWYATALCLVDGDGPSSALVVNQASGVRYWATRGGPAFRDGVAVQATACNDLSRAIIGLNGQPPQRFGYEQARAFGAAALDLCLVAEGALDAFVDCASEAHGLWDYAASVLICRQAGAVVVDAFDRDLNTMRHDLRRTPIAAGTEALLNTLVSIRRAM